MITAGINLIATIVVCLTVLLIVGIIANVVLVINGFIPACKEQSWPMRLIGYNKAEEEQDNAKSDRDH